MSKLTLIFFDIGTLKMLLHSLPYTISPNPTAPGLIPVQKARPLRIPRKKFKNLGLEEQSGQHLKHKRIDQRKIRIVPEIDELLVEMDKPGDGSSTISIRSLLPNAQCFE